MTSKSLKSLVYKARSAISESFGGGLPLGTVHTWTDGKDYMKTRDGWVEAPAKRKDAAPTQSSAPEKRSRDAETADAPSTPKASAKPADTAAKPEAKKFFNPDPSHDEDGDGVAETSRVGVPGSVLPPPPAIPRLPNLTDDEREIEEEFASDFEKNTDKMTDDFLKVAEGQNWVFETDGAKVLNAEWTRPDLPPDEKGKPINPERAEVRAIYNTAMHQTANAIAKKAFMKRLDQIADLPEDQRKILVTCGGVAAGKGTALAADPSLAAGVAATWDAAGEQNSTENPWLLEECVRRGIKPTFLYVHNDPEKTWPGAIERAKGIGRMVDARVFADSYVEGAKNFKAFHEKFKDKVSFVIAKAGKPPTFLNDVPEEALKMDSEAVYKKALDYVESKKGELPEHIYRGATAGRRIWGAK